MKHVARAAGILPIPLLLLGWFPLTPLTQAGEQATRTRELDLLRESLARDEPQAIYGPDPSDAWNQVFYLLFTRTIAARVMADGTPGFGAGDSRLTLSDRRITRIESGDRAIDPLYPSWLWMSSSAFDFAPDSRWRILREPRYRRLIAALEDVRRTASSRPPPARALMQADLWSAYDMLRVATSLRPGPLVPDSAELTQRAEALLPLVASTMHALALTGEEIARLPDTYASAAKTLRLPDPFGSASGSSDWMEIRWFPLRSHEVAANHRRVARVFVQPAVAVRPHDAAAFLNRFRDREGDDGAEFRSVALLIQLLLVAKDGTVVPSRITYEVQFRGEAARANGANANGAEIPQYELSRRQLLSSPATGGLVAFASNMPAYLPKAGNDLSFATSTRLDGEPVVAPLGARCSHCHGAGPGVGRLMTFSKKVAPGQTVPSVDRLLSADNVHPSDVARRKMDQEDFKLLRQHWK